MGLGQNDVVLAFFEPKRRRFRAVIIFFKFCLYQKDVVLDYSSSKQRRFESALTYPKRRRFISSRDKTTSFRLGSNAQIGSPVRRSSLQGGGGGGGGRQGSGAGRR